MFIALNVSNLLRGVRDVSALAIAAFCVIQLLGMFAAPRARRQHLLGFVLLVLIAVNALYDLALVPGYQLYQHIPGVRLTWGMVAANALASCAIFLLAYDFAFGKQSRSFFGLPPGKKK